jgi:hypothetical protein
MFCGRCCATEQRLRTALRLDIFIEILLDTWVNKGKKLMGRGPLLAPGMKTDGASFMLLLTDPAA